MSNLKISQLETITNMNEDSYALVVQSGKNYKITVFRHFTRNTIGEFPSWLSRNEPD